MMNYLRIPREITSAQVRANGNSWSAGMYQHVEIPTTATQCIAELITGYDKGSDPGSMYYMRKSPNYFIRTKALQEDSYLICAKGEAITPINPRVFEDMDLSDGDILVSKDSNIGECAIVNGDHWKKYTLSGGIVRLRPNIDRYYLFAFLKHPLFRTQLLALVPRGATIAHANKLWLDCRIPFPKQPNVDRVIAYVSAVMQACIEKETEIRKRNGEIDTLIDHELNHSKPDSSFQYRYPTITEVRESGRFDAAVYSESFQEQESRILNYRRGCADYQQLGFRISRGQNLQVSCIGQSVYSDEPKPGFYRLAAPTDISEYRTIRAFRHLGNKKTLDLLHKGDVIFGAEGFCKGRSVILIDEVQRTISNIHGVIFHPVDGDMIRGIFLGCFLGFLRKVGIVDAIGAGGSGGSLAIGYFDRVPFPRFQDDVQLQIARLYHSEVSKPAAKISLETFVEWHRQWNQGLGIWELDLELKTLQHTLHRVQEDIIDGKTVELPF